MIEEALKIYKGICTKVGGVIDVITSARYKIFSDYKSQYDLPKVFDMVQRRV